MCKCKQWLRKIYDVNLTYDITEHYLCQALNVLHIPVLFNITLNLPWQHTQNYDLKFGSVYGAKIV